MSSADEQTELAGKLIERLLTDPAFRAEFRRDPVEVCKAAGLDSLAAELGSGGKAMHTLELRESKSSLAGVVLAIAAEGVGVAELPGLIGHLHGPGHLAAMSALRKAGIKTPHMPKVPREIGKLEHAAGIRPPRHLSGDLAGAHGAAGGTPSAGSSSAASGAAASSAQAPGSTAASPQGTPPGAAGAHAPPGSPGGQVAAAAADAGSSGGRAGGSAAPWPDTPQSGGGAGSAAAGGAVSSAGGGSVESSVGGGGAGAASQAPDAGGGAVSAAAGSGSPAGGAGAAVADSAGAAGSGAGPGSTGIAELLASPRLAMPAAARALLAQGDLDPRLVSVLDNAVSNHTIVIGDLESVVDPVHAQSIDIISVDGQPVGPSNVGARDLITEIAALDPSDRPSEIGTPWPIHSQGFFTDPAHQARLHLAFVSQADYQPAPDAAGGAGGGGAAAGPASSAGADAGPVAATPAAQGAAQAADSALGGGGAGQSQPVVEEVAVAQQPAAGATPVQEQVVSQAAASQAPSPAGSSGAATGYVNPFPKDVSIGRTDMGVDADMRPGDAIVAPGTSRVLGIMPNWYEGQPYVALQLLDGPMKGHNYYLAEQIVPAVTTGEVVQQGQPIAHYAGSGSGIEMGWAGPGSTWEQTLAQATGRDNAGLGDHSNTPAGIAFHDFLTSLPPPGSGPAAAPPPVSTPQVAELAADPGGAPAAGSAPPAASVSAPPPAPGTATFKAVEHHEPHHHGNTVQFLAAVQPAPGSPLYGQGSGAAAGSLQQEVANENLVIGQSPGAQQEVIGQSPGAQQEVLGQGPGIVPEPSGGAISVSSHLLTSGQEKFAGRLAQLTGLDPRVVSAWELAEESGGAAQGREAAGNFNWLNIGYFDSGPGAIAFDKAFADPVTAADQTANFLKGSWGGASPGIRAILDTVGKSPDEQMMAIANSGWASSHYDNGQNLIGTYNEMSDIQITRG